MNPNLVLLALIAAGILALIAWHVYRSAKPFTRLCLYLRFFLGFIFVSSGFGKIAYMAGKKVFSFIGPVTLEAMLAPHGLALFGRFIACSQIIIGLCLLSSRLATLGAIMLVPMLLSIGVVTVSMDFKNTPFIVAFLLVLNILLLIKDWHKLKFIWAESTEPLKPLPLTFRWRKADAIWSVGALLMLASIAVFHAAPALGKPIMGCGLLIMLLSAVVYLRPVASSLHSKNRNPGS
ncbi:MAG TPA: hypothetical protein VFO10_05925 [Oligoflexus sp.]|uniref:hypothetical protein n=1 Tax=Oligoflexus sp. TaxID=1971216 RepID=UPI002D7F54B5|nr:hypothetical protein [Oligoflexus sp.]HET9236766.1 hypothetical protein [Oligoflexus sp.]